MLHTWRLICLSASQTIQMQQQRPALHQTYKPAIKALVVIACRMIHKIVCWVKTGAQMETIGFIVKIVIVTTWHHSMALYAWIAKKKNTNSQTMNNTMLCSKEVLPFGHIITYLKEGMRKTYFYTKIPLLDRDIPKWPKYSHVNKVPVCDVATLAWSRYPCVTQVFPCT